MPLLPPPNARRNRDVTGSPSHSNGATNQPTNQQTTNQQTGKAYPPNAPRDAYTPEFETFWQQYPRKIEKQDGFKAWKASLKKGTSPENLIAAAANYAEQCRVQGTLPKYVKHAATFLGPSEPFKDYIAGIPEGELARAAPKSPASLHDQNAEFLAKKQQEAQRDGKP